MQARAQEYVEHGVLDGGFISSVVTNRFAEVLVNAAGTNRAHIADWAMWLYNDIPREAWGSDEKVRAWCARGGALGGAESVFDKLRGATLLRDEPSDETSEGSVSATPSE